ncbi:MAG: stage V sporulation protein T [Xylanivirga thermophila]|jgi:AbrB family transcriptional regulator, stage V sporulation protein T|uniref:stage V sporulation protein T n=1 Tax=Xylanivirga thermophila TaxID=2496273 RepID=UPI00101CFCC7|nr:stage V sporulation protein T [Xylanivirga thermophila]
MKATGIVRRIDDLGRVVIPKEIRRTMRIREGDPLEIFTDREGEVILKKYSPIEELSYLAEEYVEAMYQILGFTVCVSDKDEIVSVGGPTKKEFLEKAVSQDLEELMEQKKTVTANRSEGSELYTITVNDDDTSKYSAQVIVPIMSMGDVIGSVIVLSKEPGVTMGELEVKMAETAANFLGRQMEQ